MTDFDIDDFMAQLAQAQIERLSNPPGWVHPNARPKSRRRPTVHQMKVTLRDVKPPIWRRVVVPSTARLDDVAWWLLAAMGWNNSHLHAFTIGEFRYDMVGDWSEGRELDETHFTLRDVFDDVGRTMRFDYDFGDGWEHDVLLEAVRIQKPSETEPYCIGGKRACPPDDVGGPGGYSELLEIAERGPESDWDRERLEWLGHHDPEAFDAADATEAMQTVVVYE